MAFNSPSAALLRRYDASGPRYTSYPTAPMWTESFDAADFEAHIRQSNAPDSPDYTGTLSLYTHLPFCEHRCLFCSCNVIVTRQRDQAERYLGYLFREIDQLAALIAPDRPVVQLHWGGGTPTYLSSDQMRRLFQRIASRFSLAPEAEISLEIDPCVTTCEQLDTLRELGFNRVSLGVQDFNPQTQQAVERIQTVDETGALISHARALGFGGVNIDLIYGLPHQSVDTMDRTLSEVLALAPDRLALYNFAYVPWISPHQNKIPVESLPSGDVKFEILAHAVARLTEAGYESIGMDHFARPQDELAVARREGTLSRNFMGYTTKAGDGCDLYGMGVSAISGLSGAYAQNVKKLSAYYEAVDAGRLPAHRGCRLSDEDRLRRWTINRILCLGRLDFAEMARRFNVSASMHFADALAALAPMAEDGLLLLDSDGLTLTPLGRLFSRNVAMPFDAYLREQTLNAQRPTFSRTL
ncbi:MAG: oxygen-independent coproporphyrinogen III oxidase [Vampirovibrionales bacterium]|nr:oxygen-independent coproporphyrinogen III oxidase [Vampirovibrionales bacterium]